MAEDRSPREQRYQLLAAYRADARKAYVWAIAVEIVHPVILIVDTQDPAGCAIIEVAQKVPGDSTAPGVTTIALVVAPLEHLLGESSPLRPSWRMVLEKTTSAGGTPGVYMVVVVAHGGCLCTPVPLAGG